MAIYFLRHGESEANAQNLFAGRFDSKLTLLGKRQALKAGKSILAFGLQFDAVHVSPLSRARITAELVMSSALQIGPIEWIISDELLERDFGVLSENNKSLIKKHFGHATFESMFHSADGAAPEGESFRAMYERTASYYADILVPAEKSGKNILVVAHKYIIEMFALVAAGLGPEDYFDFKIPNSKPSTFQELASHVLGSSPSVQRLGEYTEIYLPLLLFGAAFLGVILKQLFPALDLVPHRLMFCLSALLFAVNSYYAFLRPEIDVIRGAFSSLKLFWKSATIRALLAVVIIALFPGSLGYAAGTFFLLPPSIAAPILSLMWGGNYFLSLQSTLVLTVFSIGVFGALEILSSNLGWQVSINLLPFLILFLIGVAVPGVAAQTARFRSPIQAGSVSTNWGWLGGVALVFLSFVSGVQLAPMNLLNQLLTLSALKDVLFVVVLFAMLKILGVLAVRVCPVSRDVGRDLYISQVTPNIFFWFALIPRGSGSGLLQTLTLLIYFLSLWMEERRFVGEYARTLEPSH